MNTSLLCVIISMSGAGGSLGLFLGTWHTLRKIRAQRDAQAAATLRSQADVQRITRDTWARLMQASTGVPVCPSCGLPYALMAPPPETRWDHPYCPEQIVTV